MPTRNEAWPEGTPNWVDLGVDDIEATKTFYAELFGWEYESGGEESGGYVLAHKDGQPVAGFGPKQDSEQPTVWTTYLASDDVDAAAEKVTAAGGQLLAPVMDVMDSGRMTIAADSVGSVFGIWQAGNHNGVGRFNEDGTLCWNELHTRDYEQARQFYSSVFGFSYNDIGGGGFVYSTIKRAADGEEVGGVHHDTELPQGAPNYWLTWFATDNVDASLIKAQELGAVVLMPIDNSPFGRMSIVQGPQGEVFGLITLPSEAPAEAAETVADGGERESGDVS